MLLIVVCQSSGQIQKIPIAVLDLDASGISQNEAKILTDKLRAELFSIGKFDVMERNKMFYILQEQGFQQTGCNSNECVVQIGKLINVRNMVTGNVGKLGTKYILGLRLVDVETGKILINISQECVCRLEDLTSEIEKIALKFSGVEDREKITIKYSDKKIKERGNLYIKSVPSGASVYLNDKLQEGSTPLIVSDIPIGNYIIKLDAVDFAGETSVNLESNEFKTIELKLAKKVGRLRIITEPPQADIYLTEHLKGQSPLLIDSINIGQYHLKIKKSGYIEFAQDIKIENLKETMLDISLQKPGPLKILSTPLEAEVYIDSLKRGITPIVLTELSPGEHRIELRKDGYNSFIDKINLDTSNETTISPTLISKDRKKQTQLTKEKVSGAKLDRVIKWITFGGGAVFVILIVIAMV
jgi:TolB-like protein